MIVQIIGWFCLICGTVSLMYAFHQACKNARVDVTAVEQVAVLYLICAAICFK